MRAERASLCELGLLPDAANHWPLATWLDSTHSRPAHDALKRLVNSPLGDLTELSSRQVLLPELASFAQHVAWKELQVLAAQVACFLSSNYELVPQTVIERAYFAVRYRDIVRDVSTQLRAVDALLTLSAQVHSRLAILSADSAFGTVVAAFAAATEDSRREPLRLAVARGHTMSLIALDASVRAKRVPAGQHITNSVPFSAVLQSLVEATWQLDAFCSLATASAAVGGVIPDMVPRGAASMTFEGVRHPLLPTGVQNDLQLAANERVLFLTGPNMAGKSTLLRAIGIATYCAHLGMAVAARAACIPLHDRLMVSITVRDSLQRGESLYLAEIRRVRAVVEAVERGDAVVAIFDEVFRGTNIKDATQATSLLVGGLAKALHGTFVIASHFADVAVAHEDRAGVACWQMDVDVAGESPAFTHRVRRGVSDVHLGMLLLDAEGVGPILRRMASY